LSSLAVTSQKDLAKEQKDSVLKANKADLRQELTRADNEMVEIEHSLQQLTIGGSTKPDEESEKSKQELLQELKRQQAANTTLRDMCEEALSQTVYERTGQKIKGVKVAWTWTRMVMRGWIRVLGGKDFWDD